MKICKHLKYSNDFGTLLEKLRLLSTEINSNMNACIWKFSNTQSTVYHLCLWLCSC